MLWLWFSKRVIIPIRRALRNGVSQKRLAVSLTLGIIIGLMPFYGLTTVMVGAMAVALRLDFVIMQAVHFIVHPIQIALFIPFFKAGNYFFNFNDVNFTLKEFVTYFKLDFWAAFSDLWKLNLSAVMIWLIISIPVAYLLYFTLFYSLKRYAFATSRKRFCRA